MASTSKDGEPPSEMETPSAPEGEENADEGADVESSLSLDTNEEQTRYPGGRKRKAYATEEERAAAHLKLEIRYRVQIRRTQTTRIKLVTEETTWDGEKRIATKKERVSPYVSSTLVHRISEDIMEVDVPQKFHIIVFYDSSTMRVIGLEKFLTYLIPPRHRNMYLPELKGAARRDVMTDRQTFYANVENEEEAIQILPKVVAFCRRQNLVYNGKKVQLDVLTNSVTDLWAEGFAKSVEEINSEKDSVPVFMKIFNVRWGNKQVVTAERRRKIHRYPILIKPKECVFIGEFPFPI